MGKELGVTFGADSAGELAAGVVNMAAVGGVPIGEGRGPGLGFGLWGGWWGGGEGVMSIAWKFCNCRFVGG